MDPNHLEQRAHNGILSTTNAFDGHTHRQIRRAVRDGALIVERRGAYRVPGAPRVWLARATAALFASGQDAALSHATAGHIRELYAFDDPPELFDVTVPWPRWVRREGITCHRSLLLDEPHVSTVDGLRVTSVARTIVDAGGLLPPSRLEKLVNDSLRRDLVTPAELRRVFDDVAVRRRRHIAVCRELLEAIEADPNRGDSDLELHFRQWLHAAGYTKFRPLVPVTVSSRRFVLDIADVRARIDVEVDGWRYHKYRKPFDDDHERDLLLTQHGYEVIRVSSRTSRDTFLGAVDTAYRTVESRLSAAGGAQSRSHSDGLR